MANLDSRDGTSEALAQLIRDFGSELEERVRRVVRDADAAGNIVQHTYEKLFQRLARQGSLPIIDMKAYLFDSALKNAFTYLKQRVGSDSRIEFTDVVPDIPDRSAGPEKRAVLDDAVEQLGDILKELTPKQRRVFVLGQIERVPRREIAWLLGISEEAVDKLTTRALTSIRKSLIARGFESALVVADGGQL